MTASILAVIDTNILISGIITRQSDAPTCRIVNGMLENTFPFIVSIDLLNEYRVVLLRPAICRLHQWTVAKVDTFLEEITLSAIVRDPIRATQQAPDRNDQHLWDLLVQYKEAVLVTGDKLLLANPPSQASVISAHAFLKINT